MYPIVCTVKFYEDTEERKMNLLLYASSFEEAAHIVERYVYDIISIEFCMTGDETQLFQVTDEVAENLIKNESIMYW